MPLDSDSIKVLESVKKSGKPCKFVMVAKGLDVLKIVAYRKGSDDTRLKEAKTEGMGQAYFGVVDNQIAPLTFKLLKSDGYTDLPVERKKLKEYVRNGTDLDYKLAFELVDNLPVVEMEDQPNAGTGSTQSGSPSTSTATQTSTANNVSAEDFKYLPKEQWVAVINSIKETTDQVQRLLKFQAAAKRLTAEIAHNTERLNANPQSAEALESGATLSKLSKVLQSLYKSNQSDAPTTPSQQPGQPTQTPVTQTPVAQKPQVPQRPQGQAPNPALGRRQGKWTAAVQTAQPVVQAIRNATTCKKDAFLTVDLGQLRTETQAKADKQSSGLVKVSRDDTLYSIVDEIEAAKQLVEIGKFADAHAMLSNLQLKVTTGKENEEKARKSSTLGGSKSAHADRVAEYGKIEKILNIETARVGKAVSDLTTSASALCKSVGEMIKLFKGGDSHALNAKLVDSLVGMLKAPGLSEKLLLVGSKLATEALHLLDGEYQKRLTGAISIRDKADLLLEFGKCKGSAERSANEKGKSDSFFLNGPDGKLKYVFKPMEGESLTSADWVQGGGPVREVLSSRLNDIIQSQTGGFDCRGLKTEAITLDDPGLASGSLSQATRRVGSLQSAAAGKGENVQDLFGHGKSSAEIKAFKESFNEDDCQAIAIRHFLTFDQDAHGGNFMVDKQGDGPGQTRLIPIDAGQSLPSPDAARRNAAALRLAHEVRAPDVLNPKELLLPQLPAATKPFSGAALQAIQKLDPVKLAADLKKANDDLCSQEPAMQGKLDPGAFDLVRKSAKFLKLAAQNGLTLHEISMTYGDGFQAVIDADAQNEDAAIKNALDTVLFLKQIPGGVGGITKKLYAQGFPSDQDTQTSIAELRFDQKKRIIENGWDKQQWDKQYEIDLRTTELADMAKYLDATAPEYPQLATWLSNGFQGKDLAYLNILNYHKRKGGDPQIARALPGNQETLAFELKQPIEKKAFVSSVYCLWEDLNYMFEVGGSETLLAAIGDSFRGKSVKDQLAAFDAHTKRVAAEAKYNNLGGDEMLKQLGAQWLQELQAVDAQFQSDTAAWSTKQQGEKPGDPLTPKQRKLPKTTTELDSLLKSTTTAKQTAIEDIKLYFKKKGA